MKLYEFEGHKILTKVGIESPFFVVCENLEEVEAAKKRLKFPLVAKVQVLSGRRGKRGGVKVVANGKQLDDFCGEFFGKDFDGEQVKYIALFEKAEIAKELYVSITYDTVLKVPFLLFCQEGGVDIEDVRRKNPEKLIRVNVNPIAGITLKEIGKITKDEELADFISRLWDAFWRFDCRLVEINPIAKVGDSYVAIDAKIILDDNGSSRQKEIDVFPKGASTAVPTKREIEAKKIDAEDYRGSAGSTFIEFDGDIAILASGGGASLLVMDAVVAAGGRPANYTEYSGNPSADKVEKLTEITLSRECLSGCLVAGAVANFTDIYETLSGFAKGLGTIKPKVSYPIVIRRGGPRQNEAYEMLAALAKKEEFDIHLFGPETPISVACKKMVELSDSFKQRTQKTRPFAKEQLS